MARRLAAALGEGPFMPVRRKRAWARLVLIAVVAGLVAAVNLYLAARSVGLILGGAPPVDWQQYVEASRRIIAGGDLYEVSATYGFHYSPLIAYLFAPLSVLGAFGWRLLHIAAALALPSWPMRILALLAWPFWYDVETGNVMVFVLLAAAWALNGSRFATAAFLAMTLLIPRPLMLPLAAWLLWQRPEWRIPFAAAFVAHAVAVVALGWGAEWLAALLAAGEDVGIASNVGPSRFTGTIPWLIVGIPLALLLIWKRRLGLASLAVSPYWLPYYLLMPLLELTSPAPLRKRASPP